MDLFYETPRSLGRLGEHVFIKLPLYQANEPFSPIYINETLFNKYFPLLTSNWQTMTEVLSKCFSITLNSTKSTGKQVGWAYVDRQIDPLGFALAGNEGSGRAFYAGHEFNIKGEKTPLAISSNEKYSSGVLSLHDAIWSTIISNVFYEEIETGLSPVLAIMDLNKIHTTIIDNKTVSYKTTYVIRVDDSGSLDRVSHLFCRPSPLAKEELKRYATNHGIMEAEKIIHRFLHGAWSTANCSPDGQLMDFDTSCAVKGRQPQFTTSQYDSDNYFGFEIGGQLKVIETMLDNPMINHEGYTKEEADSQTKASCTLHVSRKLAYLMGFTEEEAIYTSYTDEFNKLGKQFLRLSHYFRYKAESCLYAFSAKHLINHLFDFSAFFRMYPLRKINQSFSVDQALIDMMHTSFSLDETKLEGHHLDNYSLVEKKTCELFERYWIKDDQRLMQLIDEAKYFIKNYDHLYTKIVLDRMVDQNIVAARAYSINEDRFYLFLLFDMAYVINKNNYKPVEVNYLVNKIIDMSVRKPKDDHQCFFYADQRLFENGTQRIKIDKNGFFQVEFKLKKSNELSQLNDWEQFYIELNQQSYKATVLEHAQYLTIKSVKIQLTELSHNYSRDDVFLIEKYPLFYGKERVRLRNHFINVPNTKNYLELLF